MRNLPESFLNSIKDVQGFDETAFIDAHQQAPLTSIRNHTVKKNDAFADCVPVHWCNEGRYLDKRPVFTLDPLFHAGTYYVQEASSMFLDYMLRHLLQDRKGLRVLDLCAAPGGKSTLIASLLDKDSLLISNEVIRSRASVLEENISRWGYMNTWVISNDAKDIGVLKGYFDVIIVDAPCSGSGLFRKDASAIDEWSEANVSLCSQRQKRILADIWPALKENGLLVYATCSYSAEENELILDWMATEFSVATQAVNIKDAWGITPTLSPKNQMYGYRFYPDKVKGEGFFLSAIQKKEIAGDIRMQKSKTAHSKDAFNASAHLLEAEDWICVHQQDNIYGAINATHEPDLQILSKATYIRKCGIALGAPGHKEWIPHHDVALGINKSANLPVIDLSLENALLFLKKENINTLIPNKGLYIASYEGFGLGWVKSLGNRFNNYLPKNLRIRMDIK